MLSQCPACQGQEFELLFTSSDRLYNTTAQKFRVVECRRCRLMQLTPRPSPRSWRNIIRRIIGSRRRLRLPAGWRRLYRRLVLRDHLRFVERAVRESGENGPLLDVGCGGGLVLRLAKDQGLPRHGPRFFVGGGSRGLGHESARRRFAQLLPARRFRAESCAAVTMFHVLEHLYEPHEYLQAAHGLLRPRDG